MIYLDHNATTPIAAQVKAAMTEALDLYGNPSSGYTVGRASRMAIEQARRQVAALINAAPLEIIFTGCGSESNNLAIKGIAFSGDATRNHIVNSAIEHPSVSGPCHWLQKRGFELSILSVDAEGRLNPDDLEKIITDKTCLVSVMLANNETGSIQPIDEMVKIAHEAGALFHTDAVQAMGKIPVDIQTLGIDLLSMSAHKFQGPKGIGALYIRKGIVPESLIHGGGQEFGLRAGTENTAGIIGLGKATELALQNLDRMDTVRSLRDRLHHAILNLIPDARLNGHPRHRLPNTLNLTLPGIRGESLVTALDREGVAISAGSACHAGFAEPSRVLMAMGLSANEANCSIRLSLGSNTTAQEIDQVITVIEQVTTQNKNAIRFIPCS